MKHAAALLVLACAARVEAPPPGSPASAPEASRPLQMVAPPPAPAPALEPIPASEPAPPAPQPAPAPAPTPAITLLEAVAVPAVVGPTPKGPLPRVKLVKIEQRRGDPVRDVPDPAPRARLTHRDVIGLTRDFHAAAPVTIEAPSAADERWRRFLAEGVPPSVRDVVETFFAPPGLDLLRAYERRYGRMESIEAVSRPGALPAFLAMFAQTSAAPPVSIFHEHARYTAVLFERVEMAAVAPPPLRAVWALDLDALYPGVLEMDDAQVAPDGTLYVNANYPSYAKEVRGRTAYLYAIDPAAARRGVSPLPGSGGMRWRAGPLVSRGEFLLAGDIVVAGYGFTDEPDYLFAIDAATGRTAAKIRIPSLHERIRLVGGRLHVATYDADLVVGIQR